MTENVLKGSDSIACLLKTSERLLSGTWYYINESEWRL